MTKKIRFSIQTIATLLVLLSVSPGDSRAGTPDEVFILQGEKGDTGDKGPTGDRGATGTQGTGELSCEETACRLPEGMDLVVDGTVTAERGVFDRLASNRSCPMGYARDESVTGLVLCQKPVADGRVDEMVKVGPFWIDRYEMTVWETPDCSGGQIGGGEDDNWVAAQNGSDFGVNDVYGCSISNEIPSRFTTWFQAAQSCLASGKYLCRNAEWQMAALGTPDDETGEPEVPPLPECNIWNGTLPQSAQWGVEGITTLTGSAQLCVSNVGAYDMVGNLDEWVEEWGIGNADWMVAGDSEGRSPWSAEGSTYGNDATWGINGQGCFGPPDENAVCVNGLPVAVVRGGSWTDGASAGVYAVSFFNAPSTTEWKRGARCCRSY